MDFLIYFDLIDAYELKVDISTIFSFFLFFKISIPIEKVRWISIFFLIKPCNLLANNCKLSSSRSFFQNLASSSSFCIMSSSYVTVEKNHTVPHDFHNISKHYKLWSSITIHLSRGAHEKQIWGVISHEILNLFSNAKIYIFKNMAFFLCLFRIKQCS